jgi:hypothetical protein
MRQQEAEEQAARRNLEDERRHRFVFYALDQSAGISPEAWDVGMRLRREEDRPVRRSPAHRAAAGATEVEAPPAPVAVDSGPVVVEELEPAGVDGYDLEPPAPIPDTPAPRRRRRLGLVRAWGGFVVLVGLAFIGAVLVLAIALRDYTHLGGLPSAVGVGAGLFAVWVGVALIRRPG